MKCFSCGKWSLKILCTRCQKTLFTPTFKTRQVGRLNVISFFRYATLEPLLLTKHTPVGYRLFRQMGHLYLRPFMQEYMEMDEGDVYIVGIDERVKAGYSHIATLTEAMRMPGVYVQHASLMAQNPVRYSGRPLQFRLENPRAFRYSGKEGINAILVDDIMTTGTTLQEAYTVLTRAGVNVLFALTLADVDEKA